MGLRMRKKGICIGLAVLLAFSAVAPVQATTITDAQNAKKKTEKDLNEVNSQINSLEGQKANLANEVEEMDSQLVDILTSISICQEEIANKEKEIAQAKEELAAAIVKEEEQDEAMKKRIKFMYEQGDSAYLQLLLESKSIADLLTKAQYMEKVYAYDKELLDEYKDTKEMIKGLKENLEEEEADLLASNYELEQEQQALEVTIAEKRNTIKNFDSKLASAKKQAETYKSQLKEQTAKIKKLEEEKQKEKEAIQEQLALQAKKPAKGSNVPVAPVNNTPSMPSTPAQDEPVGDDGYTKEETPGTPADPGDSSMGQQIASYACQFVGNPYKAGGTSLTDGADCSGFVQSVYRHFGYVIPRDSTSQRGAGRAVDYANAQPGDIICYAGHVAIYLGNGQIVHASSERTGIKYGNATYRTILSVRRIV